MLEVLECPCVVVWLRVLWARLLVGCETVAVLAGCVDDKDVTGPDVALWLRLVPEIVELEVCTEPVDRRVLLMLMGGRPVSVVCPGAVERTLPPVLVA